MGNWLVDVSENSVVERTLLMQIVSKSTIDRFSETSSNQLTITQCHHYRTEARLITADNTGMK
jgi:hypothetical protein